MNGRRCLAAGLVLLAIAVRVAAVLVLQSHRVPRSTYEHGEIAANLVAGRGFADDDAFCRDLTTRVKVAAIPLSAFYVDRTRAPCVARFAFCKADATLDEAARRLRAAKAAATRA